MSNTYRSTVRKTSSDFSGGSTASDQSTATSPTGSTQSMNSFTRKKAFFYIPDEEFDEESDQEEQCTFTIAKQPKSSSGQSDQNNHQPQPESKGKKHPRGQVSLKKVHKFLDLSLLERLIEEQAQSKKATPVARPL